MTWWTKGVSLDDDVDKMRMKTAEEAKASLPEEDKKSKRRSEKEEEGRRRPNSGQSNENKALPSAVEAAADEKDRGERVVAAQMTKRTEEKQKGPSTANESNQPRRATTSVFTPRTNMLKRHVADQVASLRGKSYSSPEQLLIIPSLSSRHRANVVGEIIIIHHDQDEISGYLETRQKMKVQEEAEQKEKVYER